MSGILAIETATEACSVAVFRDGEYLESHELAPRNHSQRLFGMLRELLPDGNLRAHGIAAIAYGCGPGSFTGLRIAASAAQGLSFAGDLPALSVSTLACQAQSALRQGLVRESDTVLSVLDARINEVYYALYQFEDSLAVLRHGPAACAPADIDPALADSPLHAVGSGCHFLDQYPASLRGAISGCFPEVLPAARDLVPLALEKLARGEVQTALEVQPVYVRDEISWKKLAEQGKRS